jgi:hypothetical protein
VIDMIYNSSTLDGELSAISAQCFRSDIEQSNPLFKVYDMESNDVATVKQLAKEMIQVNGAPCKIHIRTDNADHDKIFDEDADPTYWSPIELRGFFVPNPMEYELTPWGVDSPNKTVIVFCLDEVSAKFPNRLFRTGDLIELPYDSKSQQKPKYFKIDNAQETGNFRYNWLYLTCQTTLIVGDVNLRPAQDMINDIDEYTDEVDG